MKEKLYPNGFLFSEKEVVNIPSGFEHIKVLGELNYYYKQNSHYKIYEGQETFILIHGQFMHIGIDKNIEQDDLAQHLFNKYTKSYEEFLNTLDYIAGRFVIFVGNRNSVKIFPDATNSRSTYYIKNEIIISSHAKLLDEVFALGNSNVVTNFHNTLFNTPFKNVESVIPNFSFELPVGNIERFFPRGDNKYKNLSENEKFTLIERFWGNQIDNVFTKSNNVFLTITGGGDSRMSLALTQKYLNKLKLVTYAYTNSKEIDESNITSKVLSQDNIIVNSMVKELRLNHNFLYFDKNETNLTIEEKDIVKKNTIAIHSPFFIPFIKDNFELDNLIHIRANLLEIGQAYYYKNYKESTLENLYNRFMYKNKSYLINEEIKTKVTTMFNDFIKKTNYTTASFDYHLLDLMYWEIHMGRWHCEILNTHDYVVETVSPYNHRALIDITLSFDYEQRKNRYFQYELINRNFSVLNFFGMNELENLYEQKLKEKLAGEQK